MHFSTALADAYSSFRLFLPPRLCPVAQNHLLFDTALDGSGRAYRINAQCKSATLHMVTLQPVAMQRVYVGLQDGSNATPKSMQNRYLSTQYSRVRRPSPTSSCPSWRAITSGLIRLVSTTSRSDRRAGMLSMSSISMFRASVVFDPSSMDLLASIPLL